MAAIGMKNGSCARIAVLLASTALFSAPALAQQQQQTAQIEEVVITATKRAESMQKVPISVQAFSTKKLEEMNVASFQDYAKLLPSVSYQSFGPGYSLIYMRGIASGENANHSGPLPSVGLYLDEQPVTTIGGNLDIHVYDVARVEALAGPQGTLFGASSEAGTIRIITNKPEIGKFSAGYDVSGMTVAHGDPGYSGEGFINVPLSSNAAIRLVGWYEHNGGYIDNVKGSRTYPTASETAGEPITINNDAIAKDNYNDVTTYGGRAALKLDLNENWTVTPTVMGQVQDSNGIFSYDPSVGNLKVTHFKPETVRDRWYQAALTVEGKIANLDVVYAGAYMRRNNRTQSDYTDYSYFYDKLYGSYVYDNAGNAIDPSQYIQGRDVFTKQSHELRFQSPKDNPFRMVAGIFYQRQTHDIEQRYIIDNLNDSISVTGWNDTIWLTEQKRVDRDKAFFGEVSFDLSDKVTANFGVRAFSYDNTLAGFFGYSGNWSSKTGEAACFASAVVVPGAPCINLDKGKKGNDMTHKANLTWNIADGKMVYVTWSRGFRPGGINRRGTRPPYDPDFVDNYELGWKTSWFNNRLRLNGDIYRLAWKNMQFSYLGPNGLTEIANAGRSSVYGIESDMSWAVTDRLTVSGALAYTDAKLDVNYCDNADPTFQCAGEGNSILAPAGTQLPVTAKFKGNMTVRYQWPIGDYTAHVQASGTRNGKVWPALKTSDRALMGRQNAYNLVDLSAGVDSGSWSVDLFVKNLFDKTADMFRYTECTACAQVYRTPGTPRTIGIKFGQKF